MTIASNGPNDAPDLGVLSELAPQLAQTFVSIASDIALVVDEHGVIRNVALGADAIGSESHQWVGKPWADTVTGDTRRKVQQLLEEARAGGVTRRREVNHTTHGGHDIPVAYAAVQLGRNGPVLAVGRDLRAVTAIQQRFIDAQQAMERDYWRQRQAESRYRMLFHAATDGVLVVDATSLHVIDANQSAALLFNRSVPELTGQPASASLAQSSRAAVDELLASTRATGRPGELRALLAPMPSLSIPPGMVDLSATPIRADGTQLLLVRVRSSEARADAAGHRLIDFVERTPDAVVITDSQGRVLMANPAFAALCIDAGNGKGPLAMSPVGHALVDLLGDPKHALPGILADARRMGIAEQRLTGIGRTDAVAIDVEVSAALLAEGDQECLGLTLRRVDQRLATLPPQVGQLAAAIDRLAAQVGVVSLPELVQETADLAERHLIDAALARSQGDRLQAAQLLGITPESLWLRMRHHGLDLTNPRDTPPAGRLN